MGISKYLLVAAMSFCALGNLSAADSAKHAKKHYLDEQAISVTKEGIVVETKDGLVRVKTLRMDKNGIYIFKSDCFAVEKWQTENVLRRRCRCGQWFDTPSDYYRHLDNRECKYGHPYSRR